MNRVLTSAVGLVILIALFVAINVLAGAMLRSARVDFTEGRLYTLAEGSKRIAQSVDEQITLDFYYSSKLAAGRPTLQTYGKRVKELLEEFERVADGRINLRIYDPEPFTDLEDQAVQYGLQGMPVGDGGERFYFGLVGSNAVGTRSVIPFFNAAEEQFLEYEISRMVHQLANPQRRSLGLIAGLEIGGTMPTPGQPQSGLPAWQIAREIQALFDVRRIDPNDGRIPEDIDVLLIVHPKDLPEKTAYAIDQYVLGGGHAMIFVDPHSESDLPADPTDQVAVFSHNTFSEMPRLFGAWGVTMDRQETAADLRNAQEVLYQVSPGQREPMTYIPWISLGPDNLNQDDLVTGKLSRLNFASAGVLDPVEGATTTFSPLAWTSGQSMRMETLRIRSEQDPKRLTSIFEAGEELLTLAARITGDVNSAFPEGPPDGAPVSPVAHREQSEGPINLIIVADTELLADRFYLQQNAMGGVQKIADNADFVINGLDNLSGSSDLISLRARGSFARPFERVEELRADAEAQFRAQELDLERQIREIRGRIDRIRRDRPSSSLILEPEVQEEIAQLNSALLDARKDLRDVQLNLRRDVESLGTRLKILNTALVPAIVALGAIGLGAYRASRRRADRRAMHQK